MALEGWTADQALWNELSPHRKHTDPQLHTRASPSPLLTVGRSLLKFRAPCNELRGTTTPVRALLRAGTALEAVGTLPRQGLQWPWPFPYVNVPSVPWSPGGGHLEVLSP